MIEIKMENIGGLRGIHKFKLEKGLNILEAPNATGKTSVINGIRTLILPSDELKKTDYKHFLNIPLKDGGVTARDEKNTYVREIHEAGGNLFVSGDPLYGGGLGADVMSVAIRDNKLLHDISTGKSIKTRLDEFSDAKYYESASKILKWKQNGAMTELSRYRDELRRLEGYQKQLTELQKNKKKLLKEQEALEEIPAASAEDMAKKQKHLRELRKEETEIKIEIQKSNSRLEDIKEDIKESRRLEEYYNQQIEEFVERHPNIDREIEKIDGKMAKLRSQKREVQEEQRIINIMLDETGRNLTDATRLGVDECLACGNKNFTRADGEIRKRDLEKKYTDFTKIIGQISIEIDQNRLTKGSLQEERQKIKTEFHQKLNNQRQNLKFRENERKKTINNISASDKRIKELERKIAKAEKGFDVSVLKLMKKHDDLRYKIGVADGEIKRTERAINERADVTGQVQWLDKKQRFLGQMITDMQNKAKSISDELVKEFNKRIDEVYSVLEFKDFEKIDIDPDTFQVNIIRKREGQLIRQPIISLSDSERSTIGIILMLAGKDQFFP